MSDLVERQTVAVILDIAQRAAECSGDLTSLWIERETIFGVAHVRLKTDIVDVLMPATAFDIITGRAELTARLEALEKAAAPFVREAKNWPDYVPDSDGLFIASPDDILPILEENASQYGRASCGISYSDDVVTVGDLRALARAAGEGETK